MNILIRTAGGVPIYEQIFTQLRDEICSGALPPGEALPSIRSLARDLRVSVITTKRAYEELEQEARLREIESHLSAAAALGKKCGVTESELAEMLRLQWEE